MSNLKSHWYRGGTSKCWLFGPDEISGPRIEIESILTKAFGSKDKRQLQGIGGGTSTTSKAAVISISEDSNTDIDYLFCQVGIGEEKVEFTSNCGNCASAVALFALDQQLVPVIDEVTFVRMRNLNTGAIISARIATPGGIVPRTGEIYTPGVKEPGVGVDITFENAEGTSTGQLLPTGDSVESFSVGSFEPRATCIDAGAPACLVSSESLGSSGAETLEDIQSNYLDTLIQTRQLASVRMGLAPSVEESSPAVPKVGLVSPPAPYTTISGEAVAASEYDLSARMVSMFDAHPAIGITSVVAIARSAVISGSTVHQILAQQNISPHTDRFQIRIGTLSGVVTAFIEADKTTGETSVSVERSAYHIANAEIFI